MFHVAKDTDCVFLAAEMQGDEATESTPAGALLGDVDPSQLQDINFDDGT